VLRFGICEEFADAAVELARRRIATQRSAVTWLADAANRKAGFSGIPPRLLLFEADPQQL
jgi:hypothetical protein